MTGTAALHVVAGVLRDPQGRVLLAQRPDGKADAGLWEFPGGKVEAGETALEALRRELREELGVALREASPLIRVPVAAPLLPAALRLRLEAWRVDAFDGTPEAYEHAALAWVPIADLNAYPMPPADRPIVAALRGPDRLLVTPEPGQGPDAEASFVQAVREALAAGVPRVHLRIGDARADVRDRVAADLRGLCRESGALLVVHGDPELAVRRGVGLHWRSSQLRWAEAAERTRALRDLGLHVSASCHDAEDIALADAIGVDDLMLGPVQPTDTHPGAPILGWAGFEALRALTARPVWALGGLAAADIGNARQHGAQGVAGIRAFWRPAEAQPSP